MTNIKKEAYSMVYKFMPYAKLEDLISCSQLPAAKDCAIIHCEGIIKAIKNIFGQDEEKQPDIAYYKKVIEYIKNEM